MSSKSFLYFHGLSKKSPSLKPSRTINREVALNPSADEMKWVFAKFDTNKDGKISKDEYKAALKILGKNSGETAVNKAFEALDTDGDGFVNYQEFLAMMKIGNKSEIESAFRVYDLDGNGKISAEELMEVMKKLGERVSLESARKMIRAVDSDGDGSINMDEFMIMMTRSGKLF